MVVPQPDNLERDVQRIPEFPAHRRKLRRFVVTRAQSTPVWQYTLPDSSDTRTGTTGMYATPGNKLTTAASGLGAVKG